MNRSLVAFSLLLLSGTSPALADDTLTADSINKAGFTAMVLTSDKDEPAKDTKTEAAENKEEKKPNPMLVRLQVLLDRAHASPGVIDGYPGDNLIEAVRTYEEMNKLTVDGQIDQPLWDALLKDQRPAMITYTITKKDLDQRFAKRIPSDYAKLAEMKYLGFTSPSEMLAERFHMDETLLKTLNPKADFDKAGTEITVADPSTEPAAKVTRVEVVKSEGLLRAYDGAGNLVTAFPATIGSEDNPSPEGELKVGKIVRDPGYTYNPKKNFKQGKNDEVLDIPPGPNGPVGNIWIDLSKPTYGIHGTPEPSKIDKTQSHGCVRLTNWDAATLADLLEPEIATVHFAQ